MSIPLRLRVAAVALLAVVACGETSPAELRTAADTPAVVPMAPARIAAIEGPITTTTSTTTTVPSTTTTAPPAPPPAPPAAPPATVAPTPPPAGACGGWESTVAAHFPAEQVGKGCQVMGCETGHTFDPTIHNPTSSASGLWQFLNSTWESTTGLPAPAASYSGDVQTAAAAKLWRSSGWSPWSCA